MRSASALAAGLVAALCLGSAPLSPAQTIDVGAVFGEKMGAPVPSAPVPSGEDILRRALDNLYGFDASITIHTDKRGVDGRTATTEFLLLRKRARGARRVLSVNLLPEDVRGTRVLQVNHDDGREETYAFLPPFSGRPMRAEYRLAEPFLGTWHEIGNAEPPAEILALSEYEVLGVEPRQLEGEDVYKVTLRPLAPRGYDRSELMIARQDYAILEYRNYSTPGGSPTLIAVAPRAGMVRFGDRLVPERMSYRDLADGSEIEVTLRHEPLPDGSDKLFYNMAFHLVPLAVLDSAVPPGLR
jgi:hypothetical protein